MYDSFSLQLENSSDNVHVYDFHVVYSFSYKVPVLYFRGYHTSKYTWEHKWILLHYIGFSLTANIWNLYLGGQLLTLDEVKEGLPSHSQKVLGSVQFLTEPLPGTVPGRIVCHIYMSYQQPERFLGQSLPKRTGP